MTVATKPLNNDKILKQVKQKLLHGDLDAARALIAKAAKAPQEKQSILTSEAMMSSIRYHNKNVNITRMLDAEKTFRKLYSSFNENPAEEDMLESIENLESIKPIMNNNELGCVNYWQGRCLQNVSDKPQGAELEYFKRAVELSPYDNPEIYLRLSAREICNSSLPSVETKLKYADMGYKKMANPKEDNKFKLYLDNLRREFYNQLCLEAGQLEVGYEQKEYCYQKSLELLNDINIPIPVKYHHRIKIKEAMYNLYMAGGERAKASKIYNQRQEDIYSASRYKKAKEGVYVEYNESYR